MKKVSRLVLSLVIGLFIFSTNVFAKEENKVVLDFGNGSVYDQDVFYYDLGGVRLYKDGEIVKNLKNNLVIDLNSANYKLVFLKEASTGPVTKNVAAVVNGYYYALTSSVTVELKSDDYKDTISIDMKEYTGLIFNTKVENVYNRFKSNGIIDLSKEYVIDLSKEDQLTMGLKTFVELDKTLYYKIESGQLVNTDDEKEASIKIVGNEDENKAIMTAINTKDKKEDKVNGSRTKYTGSKLTYVGTENGESGSKIMNEIRTDYYDICNYDFTFRYIVDDYKFIEGENQTYTINKSDKMTFRINADYSLFENGGKVFIDDALVDSKNYISLSGSTIITFNKEYVDTLKVGEHTLKVVLNNNVEVATKFTINEEIKENESEEDTQIENPKTSDNVVTYLVLSIISISGIIITLLVNKKIRN